MPDVDLRRELRECQIAPVQGRHRRAAGDAFFCLAGCGDARSFNRENLLSRNFEGTETYQFTVATHLNYSYRGIMFAISEDRGKRGFRTVEKQTAREFVVLK